MAFVTICTMAEELTFSFPGAQEFGADAVVHLESLIRELQSTQPMAVAEICQREGIGGWDGRRWPKNDDVGYVEYRVRTRSRIAVIGETARILDQQLSLDEVQRLVEMGLSLEEIPQQVQKYLANRATII